MELKLGIKCAARLASNAKLAQQGEHQTKTYRSPQFYSHYRQHFVTEIFVIVVSDTNIASFFSFVKNTIVHVQDLCINTRRGIILFKELTCDAEPYVEIHWWDL